MNRLPPELHLEIIQHLCDDPLEAYADLFYLALTNKYFHGLAQPSTKLPILGNRAT